MASRGESGHIFAPSRCKSDPALGTFAELEGSHQVPKHNEARAVVRFVPDEFDLSAEFCVSRFTHPLLHRGPRRWLCAFLTGVSHIECRHASLNRINKKSQSWSSSLPQLSAYFALFASRRQLCGPFRMRSSKDLVERAPKQPKIKKSKWELRAKAMGKMGWRMKKTKKLGILRTHGGGAWKAFCAKFLRGATKRCLAMRRAAKAYRELSREEKADLEKKGHRATIAWQMSARGRVFVQADTAPVSSVADLVPIIAAGGGQSALVLHQQAKADQNAKLAAHRDTIMNEDKCLVEVQEMAAARAPKITQDCVCVVAKLHGTLSRSA